MSKYDAFGDYLKRQRGDVVPMTFAEIEKITGSKLPGSSHVRSWWSNNSFNSVMTNVLLKAGFKSEQVDMKARKLVFRRVPGPTSPAVAGAEQPFHPLYGMMQGLVRVMPGTDLTQPADPDWADRLDAEYRSEKREE
jgi:hypothetical protein